MLYKLQNGKLITPPATGVKKNGTTVTGYNRMPEDKLRAEGWKGLTVDAAPEEIPEGFELIWYFEQDDTTIYHRWQLEKLPEIIEEVEHEEN